MKAYTMVLTHFRWHYYFSKSLVTYIKYLTYSFHLKMHLWITLCQIFPKIHLVSLLHTTWLDSILNVLHLQKCTDMQNLFHGQVHCYMHSLGSYLRCCTFCASVTITICHCYIHNYFYLVKGAVRCQNTFYYFDV